VITEPDTFKVPEIKNSDTAPSPSDTIVPPDSATTESESTSRDVELLLFAFIVPPLIVRFFPDEEV